MKFGDWLVFILTFGAGLAAGAYIYFTGFRDIDIDPVSPRSINDYEIIVSHYGGCMMSNGCSSYRLVSNGSYVVIVGGDNPEEGSLEKGRVDEVTAALAATDLATQAVPVELDFCESHVDGIDTEYDITLEGKRYVLDTCSTAVDVDDELIELLDDLFADLGA